jgi:very-short-patch-repair endonuclease
VSDLPKLGKVSLLEELFWAQLRGKNAPMPEREALFCPGRKWRFDFSWPEFMVAVEVEGGVYGGRHTRPEGFKRDLAKYNEGTKLGWRIYRFSGDQITNGQALDFILYVLGVKP